jgi:thioredoxin 1
MDSFTEIKNQEAFIKALKSEYVLIDATAIWCGPCQKIKPDIAKLSKQYGEVSFHYCDVDECEDCDVQENVRVLPTFLLYKDGELFKKLEGGGKKGLENVIKGLDDMIDETSEDTE